MFRNTRLCIHWPPLCLYTLVVMQIIVTVYMQIGTVNIQIFGSYLNLAIFGTDPKHLN